MGRTRTASPVEAIDLPLAVTLAAGRRRRRRCSPAATPPDPLGALAAAAGEPDAERWWDDLVEHRGDGEPAFDAVAEAMAAVRAGTVPSASRGAARGAHAPAIRAAVNDGHATVAVVCGAWHVPALDTAVTTAAADAATLRGLPEGQGRRSAGCRGRTAGSPRPPATAPACAARAGTTTCSAIPAPTASPGSSSTPPTLLRGARHAGVARPPDRRVPRWPTRWRRCAAGPRPGLAEVLDAADAVLGGLPLVRRRARRRRRHRRGARRRAAGAAGPRPRRRASGAARLSRTPTPRVVELDLRTPNGLRRSHLLHRLVALGVAVGRARGGARLERHVPRDVAAGVGARAVGAPRRARRPRHHRRAGGDHAGSSSGPPAPTRLARRRRPPSSWRCSADLPTRVGPAVAGSRRAGRPRPRRRPS